MPSGYRLPAALAAVACAAALGLSACSASSSPSASGPTSSASSVAASKIKLAAVLANTSDPFWTTVSCGAQAEAKKLGVSLAMFTSTSTDTNAIASDFQSASLTHPQGMLADPFNNNQFITQYKALMAQGVPIVTGNDTVPPEAYQDIFSAGDTARFAAPILKSVPSTGSMVYLGGAPGIPPLLARTMPFLTAVEKARPGLKVLPTEYSGFDINKVTTDLSSIILANPDLKLIVVADGPDAEGAAAAVQQAGKAGKITVVAFDAIPPEVAALKAGTITALIAQAPAKIGAASIAALVSYIKAHPKGGAISPIAAATIPNQLLTAANVDSPANADWVYKASC